MIIQGNQKRVVQSHDFDEVNCTIDAEDMRYVASLLRNNYSNTSLAVIREITANAVDANKEANSTRKVEVKLPTTMNPTFSVRAYGSGLYTLSMASQPRGNRTIILVHLALVSLHLYHTEIIFQLFHTMEVRERPTMSM